MKTTKKESGKSICVWMIMGIRFLTLEGGEEEASKEEEREAVSNLKLYTQQLTLNNQKIKLSSHQRS